MSCARVRTKRSFLLLGERKPVPKRAAPEYSTRSSSRKGSIPTGVLSRSPSVLEEQDKMFGIGPTEMVIIGVLFLVIFGPSKLPSMARDLGRFINEARRSADAVKSELMAEDVKEVRDGLKDARRSARRTVNEFKSELTLDEGKAQPRRRRDSRGASKPPQTSTTEEPNEERERS